MTPMMCMAVALFFEARSESVDAMIAVGQVIMNRVESQRYPDTVCGVVNQSKQFSFTHDGKSDNPLDYDSYHDKNAWKQSKEAAIRVMYGEPEIIIEGTHYHADYVEPYWITSYELEGKVGTHLFYKERES